MWATSLESLARHHNPNIGTAHMRRCFCNECLEEKKQAVKVGVLAAIESEGKPA